MPAKKNSQVEHIEWEVAALHKQLSEIRKDPGGLPVMGCGDHSCIVKTPTGMATNGGCRCEERELRRAVMWYKRYSKFLEQTIEEMNRNHEIDADSKSQ